MMSSGSTRVGPLNRKATISSGKAARHVQRRQTDLPQLWRGCSPSARTLRRVQGETVDPRLSPAPGSNRLPAVVKALRRIQAAGGEIRFSCRVEDIDLEVGGIRGVATSSGYIPASVVLVAIGHAARDTLAMLVRRGVLIVPKPFQMGVRIEQPQETVNRVKYGGNPLEDALGAADYNVVARGPHDLFPFA